MPATLRIDFADGSHVDRRVPVEIWLQRTAPEMTLPTQQRILHLSFDPDAKFPDRERGGNRFDFPG